MDQQAIIFDFGGVLFDWDYRRVFRPFFAQDEAALENFLQEVDFLEWNRRMDAAQDFSHGVAEVCRRFPHYCHLIRAYDEHWLDSIGGTIPTSVAWLQRLKASGCALYGITNFNAAKFRVLRPHFPFLQQLEWVLVSGEVGLLKPDARIFRLFQEQSGRRAQDCLLIDDSLPNVESARELGWQALHYTGPASLDALAAFACQEG